MNPLPPGFLLAETIDLNYFVIQRLTGIIVKKTIFITCLTRMNDDFVCVAGIDKENNFLRPVAIYPKQRVGIRRDYVFSSTGDEIIRPMTYVEFDFLYADPDDEYHTEDWVIDISVEPRVVSRSNDHASRRILERSCESSLTEALAKKDRSLVTIRPASIPKIIIKVDEAGRLRCRFKFRDSSGDVINSVMDKKGYPGVTDAYWIALCKHLYNNGKSESEIAEYLEKGLKRVDDLYLIIGLTREWHGNHWRQISGVLTVPHWLGKRTYKDFDYDWTDFVQRGDS